MADEFEHYAQVVPSGFFHIVCEHITTGVPDVQLCTFGFASNDGLMALATLEAIATAWADKWVPSMNTLTTFTRATASDADGVMQETFVGLAGSNTDDPSPMSEAMILEKRTGIAGRRNRGRMFIPIMKEDVVDIGGNIESTTLATWQGLANGFLTQLEAIDTASSMVILHSKGWNGDVEPADPGNAPAPTVVQNLVVKAKIGTQRRRLR